jgi:hypothetical protein
MKQATRSLIALAAFLGSRAGLADTLRVPADQATIQAALTAARGGDTVLVAAGEYVIREPLSFEGKAVTLRSEDGPSVTVIRMADDPTDPLRACVIIFEAGEPEATLVEGFTLTGGLGTRTGDFPDHWGGGAILCRGGAQPTVAGCLITGNRAINGGGVMVDVDSSITLVSCTIRGNLASSLGGGVLWVAPGRTPVLRASVVEGNAATAGGGLFAKLGASPEITDCLVSGNRADGPGGVMCCLVDSSPRLERCTLLGNLAGEGGALSLETRGDSPVLVNCLLAGNLGVIAGAIAAKSGAAPRLMNCTVSGNASLDEGGVVNCTGVSAPRIVNSIVWGNSLDLLCGDVSFTVNSGQDPFLRAGSFDFERFQDVMVAGEPRRMPDFILDAGDYGLVAGSAPIDSGTGVEAPPTDLLGQARPCGEGFDAGAREFCEGDPPGESFRRADSNADTRVDLSDGVHILEFLFRSGPRTGCDRAADANDSGSVDISDPAYLLNYLFLGGPPPPSPATGCGLDTTPDGLGCRAYLPCRV